MSKKTPDFKNDSLKSGLQQWKRAKAEPDPKPPAPTPALPKPPPRPQRASTTSTSSGPDDEALFQLAMEEVAPIRKPGRQQPSVPAPPAGRRLEDAEALASLSELVAVPPVEVLLTNGRLTALASGADRGLVDHLAAGSFGAPLDLDLRVVRGIKVIDEIERAVARARRAGVRVVRVLVADPPWTEASARQWAEQLRAALARPATGRIVLAAVASSAGPAGVDVLVRR